MHHIDGSYVVASGAVLRSERTFGTTLRGKSKSVRMPDLSGALMPAREARVGMICPYHGEECRLCKIGRRRFKAVFVVFEVRGWKIGTRTLEHDVVAGSKSEGRRDSILTPGGLVIGGTEPEPALSIEDHARLQQFLIPYASTPESVIAQYTAAAALLRPLVA